MGSSTSIILSWHLVYNMSHMAVVVRAQLIRVFWFDTFRLPDSTIQLR